MIKVLTVIKLGVVLTYPRYYEIVLVFRTYCASVYKIFILFNMKNWINYNRGKICHHDGTGTKKYSLKKIDKSYGLHIREKNMCPMPLILEKVTVSWSYIFIFVNCCSKKLQKYNVNKYFIYTCTCTIEPYCTVYVHNGE